MDSSDEKLLGDHVEDMLKKMKIDKLRDQITKLTGKACNCNGRKEKLNQLHKELKELLGE